MVDKYTTFEMITDKVAIDCTLSDKVWKVYQMTAVPSKAKGPDGKPLTKDRLMPQPQTYKTRDEALAAAKAIK